MSKAFVSFLLFLFIFYALSCLNNFNLSCTDILKLYNNNIKLKRIEIFIFSYCFLNVLVTMRVIFVNVGINVVVLYL